MSEQLPPDESSIAAAVANPGRRKAAAHDTRGVTNQLGGKVNRENRRTYRRVHGQRAGRRSRAKGDRIEREIVSRHAAIGIKAERYPLSGASRFRGSGPDIDIYPFRALVAEVKSQVLAS